MKAKKFIVIGAEQHSKQTYDQGFGYLCWLKPHTPKSELNADEDDGITTIEVTKKRIHTSAFPNDELWLAINDQIKEEINSNPDLEQGDRKGALKILSSRFAQGKGSRMAIRGVFLRCTDLGYDFEVKNGDKWERYTSRSEFFHANEFEGNPDYDFDQVIKNRMQNQFDKDTNKEYIRMVPRDNKDNSDVMKQ